MTRQQNYTSVLAFRVPDWVKERVDARRGPGEDRSDVLRDIVIKEVTADAVVDEEDE